MTAPAGYRLVDALPGLVFAEPVAVVSPPGETNRLFIAERTGLVWTVTNLAAPDKTLCADLRAGLDLSFIEQGLLGMVFHPGFATYRQVFFTSTTQTVTTSGVQNTIQLLRFTVPAGAAPWIPRRRRSSLPSRTSPTRTTVATSLSGRTATCTSPAGTNCRLPRTSRPTANRLMPGSSVASCALIWIGGRAISCLTRTPPHPHLEGTRPGPYPNLVARLAGLTFRQGPESNAAHVTLGFKKGRTGGGLVAVLRPVPGSPAVIRPLAADGVARVKLERHDGRVRGYAAADGGAWLALLDEPFPYAEAGWAGALATSSDPAVPAGVWLEEFALDCPRPPAAPPDVSTGIVDTGSQGDGAETYGTEGWWMPAIGNAPPREAELQLVRGETFVWGFNSGERRVLRLPGSDDRKPTTWFSADELILDLVLGDTMPHRVGLYFLDYGTVGIRVQTLEFLDPATGHVLERRELAGFADGVWVVSDMQGAVRLRITNRAATGNAVLSGIFVGPATQSDLSVVVEPPASPVAVPLPGGLELRADVGGGAGAQVEFLVNGRRVAEAPAPPYTAVWPEPLAGTHELRARVTDPVGRTRLSEPVAFTVVLPEVGARFLGVDEATRGDWSPAYGNELSLLPGLASASAPKVEAEFQGTGGFAWGPVEDPRALRHPDGSRVASCWFSSTNLSARVVAADGRPRRVTLYCLDWDYGGREQRVEVVDPASGAVLDRREITDFGGGRHLSWEITGAVEFRVTARVSNAVLSGVFVDPSPSSAHFAGVDETTGGDWRGGFSAPAAGAWPGSAPPCRRMSA